MSLNRIMIQKTAAREGSQGLLMNGVLFTKAFLIKTWLGLGWVWNYWVSRKTSGCWDAMLATRSKSNNPLIVIQCKIIY
jgi:hypothetical protein